LNRAGFDRSRFSSARVVAPCLEFYTAAPYHQVAMTIKRILFVCVENSNRSQMAEAFARIHGAGKVEAYSAGSRPSGTLNPKAVEAMREVGYDLTAHQSKSLADLAGLEFDVAVTMGCGDECPSVKANRRVEWTIPDPKGMAPEQFRDVRDLIEAKVKELLSGLCADTR
jgi:arsenate reductase (thioredoxin)